MTLAFFVDLNRSLQTKNQLYTNIWIEISPFFIGLIVLSSFWLTIVFFKKMIVCNKKLAEVEVVVKEIEKKQNKKINNIISENTLLIKQLNQELDFIKRQKSEPNKLSAEK